MKKSLITLAGLALTASVTTAVAAPEEGSFRWSASDLNQSEGIVTTHQRLTRFAHDLCREQLSGTRSLSARAHCMAAVKQEVLSAVANPRLSSYAASGALPGERLAGR
jgi:UrcA family protein